MNCVVVISPLRRFKYLFIFNNSSNNDRFHVQATLAIKKAGINVVILISQKLLYSIFRINFQGKHLDKTEFLESLNRGGNITTPLPTPTSGTARLRGKAAASRARPKTIHVDSSALHAAEGMLATKQPSSTNLTGRWCCLHVPALCLSCTAL